MYARLDVTAFLLANGILVTEEDISKANFAVCNGPLPAPSSTNLGDRDRIPEAKVVLALLKKYQAEQKCIANNATNPPILTQFSSRSLLQSHPIETILEESCGETDDNDEKENKAFGLKGDSGW